MQLHQQVSNQNEAASPCLMQACKIIDYWETACRAGEAGETHPFLPLSIACDENWLKRTSSFLRRLVAGDPKPSWQ
jgi:hypothetical protein